MKITAFLKSTLTSFTIFSLMLFSLGNVFADPGSIWTTTSSCGADPQDENHYVVGSSVHINGDGFNPGVYSWDITGQPGSSDPGIVVASGSVTVDASGTFCFDAYIIQPGDDGEYKADVNHKFDNYNVEGVSSSPSPSPSPTSTPTATPDSGTSTPTATPTASPTASPTATPTSTPSPVLGDSDTTDVCANIDGIQTSVPADYHIDASGRNCVQFSQSDPGNSGGASSGQVLGASTIGGESTNKGQVLGASTLGATGSDQMLMVALYILGGLAVSCGVGVYAFSKEDLVVDRDYRI